MKKYIVIITAFILISGIVIFSVLMHKRNIQKKDQNQKQILPPEIVHASEEFQKNIPELNFRIEQSKKLIPYLRLGLPKEKVLDLLGKPDMESELKYYSQIEYTVSWSNVLTIYFDKNDRLIHVGSPEIKYKSHHDRAWPLVCYGMSKSEIMSRLGNEPSVILDDGKKWQYKDDTYLYWVTFDDEDKVIDLEKTKRKTEKSQG